MRRFVMIAATMAVATIALGGCGTPQPRAPLVAEPETVGKMADQSGSPSAAEPTAEPTAGGGDRGPTRGSVRGLVTRVSHQPNGGHWITVEKDPGADCDTRAERRSDPCEKWGLQILDDTVVLRGEGNDARPASPSDVEEGQTVLAFPANSAEFESYPPTSGADKVVIVGPGVSNAGGAGTAGRAGASGGDPEVFLARQLPGSDFATSKIRGKLVLDERGCFLIDGLGRSLVPVWPSGFEARADGEGVRVLDGRGRTVARVGERIVAVGGALPSLEDLESVDEEAARETQERCPSKEYWLVGGGVRVTPRGLPSDDPR